MDFSPMYNAALFRKEVFQEKQGAEDKIREDFNKRKRRSAEDALLQIIDPQCTVQIKGHSAYCRGLMSDISAELKNDATLVHKQSRKNYTIMKIPPKN